MSLITKLTVGAGALAVVLLPGMSSPARAQVDIYTCAKRVSSGITKYSEDLVGVIGDCSVENIKRVTHVDCVNDPDVSDDLANIADKMRREALKCGDESARARKPC